ncbi:hypothetical protein PENTCL1PPCAC_17458 [Pristionchus entomophagus]|uniref:Bestrophin homolog n=1 Tax=Pristionchus entomophagus TaxID=358040 RepID=A0AAV5TM50_9BILA|nr:hypothetical protein PENTCL1PPCAC_17458 [Pristionchus entomophagus]
MTVSYNSNVSTASHLIAFYKVMFRWKGSVWKLVALEMLVWYLSVVSILALDASFIARCHFGNNYREFIKWLNTCANSYFIETLPFLLGFTTGFCFDRWFAIFGCLDWPNNAAHMLNTFMRRQKLSAKREAKLRNTFARHLRLAYILIFRDISMTTRKRAPTLEFLVKAGWITQKELEMLHAGRISEDACKYWIPLQWIIVRIREMRAGNKKDSLMSDYQSVEFFQEIATLRGNLGDLLSFDWVPMPIAFMQIITAAVYITMFLTVFTVQDGVVNEDGEVDYLTASWTIVTLSAQLLLYLGWMKSVHVIINPFGEDDDDFEMEYLLDHHTNVLNTLLVKRESGKQFAPAKGLDAEPNLKLSHTVGSLLRATDRGIKGSMADVTPREDPSEYMPTTL